MINNTCTVSYNFSGTEINQNHLMWYPTATKHDVNLRRTCAQRKVPGKPIGPQRERGKGIRGRLCHNLNHTETKFVDDIPINNCRFWTHVFRITKQSDQILSLVGGLSNSHEGAKSLPSPSLSLSRAQATPKPVGLMVQE